MDTPWISFASHGLAITLYLTVYAWVFIGLALACVNFAIPQWGHRLTDGPALKKMGIWLAVVLTGIYVMVVVVTMSFPGYVDPCEPLVIAASYFTTHGTPVYNTVIAYGPYCFLPFSLAMNLFGNSMLILRTVVVAGNVLLIALLFALFRRRIDSSKAFIVVALVLGSFLLNQNYILQIRGDLFICLGVTLGMISVTLKRPLAAVVLMSLAVSGTTGVKITALLYVVYPLLLFWKRYGSKPTLCVAGLSTLLNLAPFAIATLSLRNYLRWLAQMAHEPRSDREFVGNVVVTVILFSPVLLVVWEFALRARNAVSCYVHSQAVPIVGLLASVFTTVFLSAKFGAGRHHVSPFAIIIAYLAVDIYTAMQGSLRGGTGSRLLIVYCWGCWSILLVFAEASELKQLFVTTQEERSQAVALAKDIAEILDQHPHTRIELGYGHGTFDMDHHYSEVYAAPQLIFRGNPSIFDLSAEADRELMNIPLTHDKFSYLSNCKVALWLIPREQTPFRTKSIYSGMYPTRYPNHYLFPSQFEHAFLEAYVKIDSTKLFDLYACRNPR